MSRKKEDWVGSGVWETTRTWEGKERDPEKMDIGLEGGIRA